MVQNTRRKTFKWRVRLYGLAERAAPVWTADVGSLRSATVRQAVFVLSLLYLSLTVKRFGGKDQSEDLGEDAGVIFRRTLSKYDRIAWSRVIWLRAGSSGGLL